MTTGGELKKVQSEDRGCLNTGNVAECTDEFLAINLGIVDHERATALAVSSISQFTLSCTEFARLLDFDNVRTSTDSLQESCGCGGLDKCGTFKGCAGHDKRNFRHGGDAVATSQNQSWDSAGCNGRSSCESPINVSLANGVV